MVFKFCGRLKVSLMTCHSVRDFFLAILLVSAVSMTILYELSLPWIQRTEKELLRELGRADGQHQNGESYCIHESRKQGIKVAKSGLPDRPDKPADILAKVLEIETRLLGVESKPHDQSHLARIRGNQALLDQELPVYEPILKKHGFVVQVPGWYGGRHSKNFKGNADQTINEHSAAMLILMDDGISGDLSHNASQMFHQKVNQIPELLVSMTPPQNLCETLRWASKNKLVDQGVVSPDCYILPEHQRALLQESKNGTDSWKVQSLKNQSEDHKIVQWQNKTSLSEFIRLAVDRTLVQRAIANPFLLSNCEVVIKVFVLVTSIRPLRAYLHSQTTVQLYDTDHNLSETLTGDQWSETIFEEYSSETLSQLNRNLHWSITELLLLADSSTHFNGQTRCATCFQLLELEVTFNSTFHAFILEVKGQPRLDHRSSWSAYVSKQQVIEDSIAMLTVRRSVAGEVARLMTALNLDITGISGCPRTTDTCLQESHIQYLLESKRENLSLGSFVKLYPTRLGDEHLPLVHKLSTMTSSVQPSQELTGQPWGLDLHSLLTNVERFYSSIAAQETDVAYDDVNIPMSNDNNINRNRVSKDMADFHPVPSRQECSKDKTRMPYLSAIHFSPPLTLSPDFSPAISDYLAEVDYNIYLVEVSAVAESCYCEARLEEIYGIARPANVTLGIGDNKITIFVVDLSHGEPWVINTYSVVIYRRGQTEGLKQFTVSQPHRVCSIKQDCSLRYSPRDSCGIKQAERFYNWSSFTQFTSSLPVCNHGDEPGEWYVPCDRCDEDAVCYWDEAKWQPYSCYHVNLDREKLPVYFQQKKILFIGDSTSRGMFHYMAEGVNRTLTEWDKTHNLKIYDDLNEGTTLLGFAYYPQFWLPESRRPVFEDALYQLVKRTGPLSNDSNTVLVVGGVHWLSTHHINVITDKLYREGLTGIQVIIKGLGSGFHQPVQGLHCLSKVEHQKLLHRNNVVTKYARDQGFQILETFNMTMSRYKDFLQGKCACHFHRVSPVHHGKKPAVRRRRQRGVLHSQNGANHPPEKPLQYHVEGEINAVYSEILINMICKYKPNIFKIPYR